MGNDIAGEATKKLNDEKKHQEAAKIQAEADKTVAEANRKKAAAEGMITKIDNAHCSKHAGCKGLDGYCCPTLNFAKMHLGSAKLSGPVLGCCGSATELDMEAPAELAAVGDESTESDGFGASAMLFSALCGSALTMAAS